MHTVWVVDDDDEMNHAIKLMLQMLNFSVEIFRDARSAAHRLMEGARPDVIVLDINMPGVTGIDLLEFMRMRKELMQLPVVMLSSETTDVQVDEAMHLGANAFIFKPITIDELETAIHEAIGASAASD